MDGWTVPPMWQGERCFIIAGGQSVPRGMLTGATLPGRVIAIKDAAYMQPHADIFFYADRRLHKDRKDVWAAYKGPLRVKRSIDCKTPRDVRQVQRALAPRGGISGLSTDRTKLGGWDSGGSAINLAYHLGVREIVLIGFDLSGSHWNPAHPVRHAPLHIHEIHRRSIDAMAKPLRAAGVSVVNTSPSTSLREYPHADLKTYFAAG